MKIREGGWTLIFLAAILLIVVVSIAAYLITGNKGVEERFSSAAGLNASGENEGDGVSLFGFRVEGNIISYVVILAIMVAVCAIIYLKFKI